MSELETSALRFVQNKPHVLSATSKRMVLRLIPYMLLSAFLFPRGVNNKYEGNRLRLAILATLPNTFICDQTINAALTETKLLKAKQPSDKLHGATVRPEKFADAALLYLGNQMTAVAMSSVMKNVHTLVLDSAINIEQIYNRSPSDISKAAGEIFSTTLENLGRDVALSVKGQDIFEEPLFQFKELNSVAAESWKGFTRISSAHPEWSFWREWYQGFLDGQPLDWALQRRVALIPDEDWGKGPEHIALLIAAIRARFEAEKSKPAERHKELEPSSVEHLLTAPLITANQIDAAAQDIRDAECKYLNDTGANALPEAFQCFPSIALSLAQISQSIRSHQTTPSVEDDLQQQIGRLNARVIELEAQLSELRHSKDPTFRNTLKEQAGKSLGDWKMYAALFGAVWMISGDTIGMKARLENLGATRDAIFGTAHPSPAEPIGTLPNTTDV